MLRDARKRVILLKSVANKRFLLNMYSEKAIRASKVGAENPVKPFSSAVRHYIYSFKTFLSKLIKKDPIKKRTNILCGGKCILNPHEH